MDMFGGGGGVQLLVASNNNKLYAIMTWAPVPNITE